MAEPNTDGSGDGHAYRVEMSRRTFFKGAGLSAATWLSSTAAWEFQPQKGISPASLR
jgi:hypothetical protein